MALDGAFLHFIKMEIASHIGARIDKIHQPSREEIIITLRGKGYSDKLLLSAGADSPRVHFTQESFENPKTPPMFCMLLRKHLGCGKLSDVRQIGMDRVLELVSESMNEFGDRVTLTLVVEIMGRHSNIVLVNKTAESLMQSNESMKKCHGCGRYCRYGISAFAAAGQVEFAFCRTGGGAFPPESRESRRFVQGIGTGVPRSFSGFGKGDCRICNPLS